MHDCFIAGSEHLLHVRTDRFLRTAEHQHVVRADVFVLRGDKRTQLTRSRRLGIAQAQGGKCRLCAGFVGEESGRRTAPVRTVQSLARRYGVGVVSGAMAPGAVSAPCLRL